jgi:hypothetical protein
MLNRLLAVDGRSFDTVEQFRVELALTRDQPTEVTSDQRAAHLTLLTAALFVPLLLMFALPSLYTVLLRAVGISVLNSRIREEQRVLGHLHGEMRRDLIFSLLQPDPLVRANGLARFNGDMDLDRLLDRKGERHRFLENQLRQSSGWMAAGLLRGMEGWMALPDNGPDETRDVRKDAADFIRAREALPEVAESVWLVGLICVVPLPLIWVLCAFLLRGGITLRLAGIALVRANGGKAFRMQCAWRALLVWIPVVALLALSGWFDGVWLGAWLEQNMERYGQAHLLSWVCWGCAVSLLPFYVGLALWLPGRSVHDRLAGTYLVPR